MRLLKLAVAVVSLIVLFVWVDLRALWEALCELTLASVVNLALIAFALIAVSAWKWQCFIEELGKKLSIVKLFALYLVGYFVNVAFPSYVGGDLVRSYYVGKEVGQHNALAATILERYTGLVAMLCLALMGAFFCSLVTPAIRVTVVLASLGLCLCTVIALSERSLKVLHLLPLLGKLEPSLRKIQTALHLARQNQTLFVKALVLSFIYHTITIINTVVCAAAVGWSNVPLIDLAVVLPLILLIGALPISPNGLGIQEGAFFFFLKAIGASPAQALAIGVVLRAKTLVLAVLGALVWIGMKREVAIRALPENHCRERR